MSRQLCGTVDANRSDEVLWMIFSLTRHISSPLAHPSDTPPNWEGPTAALGTPRISGTPTPADSNQARSQPSARSEVLQRIALVDVCKGLAHLGHESHCLCSHNVCHMSGRALLKMHQEALRKCDAGLGNSLHVLAPRQPYMKDWATDCLLERSMEHGAQACAARLRERFRRSVRSCHSNSANGSSW